MVINHYYGSTMDKKIRVTPCGLRMDEEKINEPR
jgi:hypothetical protein